MELLQHLNIGGENWFSYAELYDQIVQRVPDPAHLVEVGCWKGRSVAHLAVAAYNTGKAIKVDAVDTWLGSAEHIGYECLENDGLYRIFLENIAPIRHLIRPVRMLSVDAADGYMDGSLDFVFLDASHDYVSVKSDILAWKPKIKKGGIMAGHDYREGWVGVDQAVNEIFGEREGFCSCWMVDL
jgi:SAM-dependent methyltransferase